MIRSVLMRRLFAAVFSALILVAVITWLVFQYMSDSVFIQLRAADIMPRARAFALLADKYIQGELAETELMHMASGDDRANSLLNAYAVITDRDGRVLFRSERRGTDPSQSYAAELSQVMRGESVFNASSMRYGLKRLVAGVPVYHGDEQVGGLLLYMPEVESAVAKSVMSSALRLAIFIALPGVMLLMYVFIYKMVRPLSQMRDVALSMAQGSFSVRANDAIAGEVGQLGASLNILAKELDRNISALTLERNRLVQMLDSLDEGIAAVDKNGIITHINSALGELFGVNRDEDDPCLRVIPFDTVWEAFGRARLEGEACRDTVRQNGRDISYIILPVYDDKREIAGAVGTFRDVSKELMLERTRREYVANVSHEMRTPLTALRGLIEPLRDGMVKDEAARQRYYDIILRETLRLSRLINDIMELSRLQSGTTSIQRENFDPKETVFDLGERYGAMAAEHGLKLVLTDNLSRLPRIYFNQDRLEQILVILLDNAIKYTKEGTITLDAAETCGKLVFSVRDTGLGISEENLPHVFERFFKVDKAHSGMGSGLGLSIAKEVLTAMGEEIRVRSEYGKGTEFAFTAALEQKNYN